MGTLEERVMASWSEGFLNEAGLWPRVKSLCFFFLNSSVLYSTFSPLHPSDVEKMAIDWLTGNFYFVDDVDDRVFVCNKNGQTCVTLLDQELYNPKGIALDPAMGSVLPSALLDLKKYPQYGFSIIWEENAVLCSDDVLTKQAVENQSTSSRWKLRPILVCHTHTCMFAVSGSWYRQVAECSSLFLSITSVFQFFWKSFWIHFTDSYSHLCCGHWCCAKTKWYMKSNSSHPIASGYINV